MVNRKVIAFFLGIIITFFLASCAKIPRSYKTETFPVAVQPYIIDGKTYYPLPSTQGYSEICYASWYGPKFHKRLTASGEVYNMYAYTAAHRILPFGTYVLVENLENGRKVVVRINDRGPFVKGRCIDLSYAAARDLGMLNKGVVKVRIVALGEGYIEKNRIVYKNIPNIRFNKFFFQVGSFKNYQNARRLKYNLIRAGYRVRIDPYRMNGKLFYRVQIFLSNDLKKAYYKAQKLKKFFPDGFIVAQ